MAFSKKQVEDRKTWLSRFVPGTFLDSEAAKISYSDFVHKVPALLDFDRGRVLCAGGNTDGM